MHMHVISLCTAMNLGRTILGVQILYIFSVHATHHTDESMVQTVTTLESQARNPEFKTGL
jgi:hypothetical protein